MKNSEQPAFPLSLIKTKTGIVDSADIDGGGLTKREYFAAMAMQGLCANSIPGQHHSFQNTAAEAMAYANALLKQLES